MKVRTARRSTGGVAMTLMSRTPLSAICKVRGIGVAVSVSTCASALSRFKPLLVGDAEMLLLVHDDEAEVVERDGGAEQRMGADDDVDFAAGDAALDRGLLLGGHQARELGDLHRQPGEALSEGLEMLPAEQGGGRQHPDLLAGVYSVEGRAQRHPPSCRSPHRRRPAGPSRGLRRDRRWPRRWRGPDRRSRRRGSPRRRRRRARPAP